MNLEEILCRYQERIGFYDKQSWETTVEQHILRGLSYSPCKTAKLKTDLIDVDLVRGSTFPKAKPQSDVWFAGLQGIVKLLFCPLYFHWWIKETTFGGYLLVISMYCSVISASLIFYNYQHDDTLKNIPGFEVFLPVFLLLLLSVIHSQMICPRRKGIKVPVTYNKKENKETYYKYRRSRSSRRSFVSHSKARSSYSSVHLKSNNNNSLKQQENSVVNKSTQYDLPNRAQSEDEIIAKSSDKNYRSVSESNLNCVTDTLSSCGNAKQFISSEVDSSKSGNVRPEDDSMNTPTNDKYYLEQNIQECHLRYRGASIVSCTQEATADIHSNAAGGAENQISLSQNDKLCCTSKNGAADLAALTFPVHPDADQTSDGGSDEGCSADCESPVTDGEKSVCNNWTDNIKRCMDIKQKQSKATYFSPRNSLTKVPVNSVDANASNSSLDSEGEREDCSSTKFNKQKQPLCGWTGITTNSEDPSYSSETEAGWEEPSVIQSEPIDWHIQGAPAAVISSTKQVVDKVGCKIWEDSDIKKVDLSVLDISSAVISRVDNLKHSSNYLTFGLMMSVFLALVPSLYRLLMVQDETAQSSETSNSTAESSAAAGDGQNNPHQSESEFLEILVGNNLWSAVLILLNTINRLVLGTCIFFLLSVAERTFKQRFLYAKHFCFLTSARRARKYDLPHFRLNKVINIKAWLSIRSCLKKRGPQHSIDVIVSATFIVTLILVFYLGVETIKDEDRNFQPLHNCELFVWCFAVSIYLIRFMTLGALINKKYSNPSVLITEQINMYFHMEQNPQKKDKLMLANNVLKLVSVLLKELDSPFKISGLSANTLLYNITKFGILSACSGVLSNLLGFKLKLHNIKFK